MASITTRYFRVLKDKGAPDLVKALQAISAQPHAQRQRTLTGNVHLRLERLGKTKNQHRIVGEMVRIHTEDFPNEVHADGLKKLNTEYPLGYGVAFALDIEKSIIALQHDMEICGTSRFTTYLRKCAKAYKYEFRPIVDKKMWEKFSDGEVTRYSVRVASPETFDFAEDDSLLGSSIAAMANAYSSPYITIEMSVGHKKTTLSDLIKVAAEKLNLSADVEWMKAKVAGEPEEIDLNAHMLKDSNILNLADVDPDTSYKRRAVCVLGNLEKRWDDITSILSAK